uniref:Uncharacterized protein n=1 Tax=Oryzias latipes TaxID=8090 RepID=A0A3B3IGR9_ORYLA
PAWCELNLRGLGIKLAALGKAGNGCTKISQCSDVLYSTVRQTVSKWGCSTSQNSKVSVKDLQKSLAHAHIFVDIKGRMEFTGGHWTKAPLPRKNTAARLKFFTALLGKYSEHTELCVEIIGTTCQRRNLIPTVKYGAAVVMFQGFFGVLRPGQINQDVYPENLRSSVCQMKLNRKWVMRWDKNPNQSSKTTTE